MEREAVPFLCVVAGCGESWEAHRNPHNPLQIDRCRCPVCGAMGEPVAAAERRQAAADNPPRLFLRDLTGEDFADTLARCEAAGLIERIPIRFICRNNCGPFELYLPTTEGREPVRPSFCPFCGEDGKGFPGWKNHGDDLVDGEGGTDAEV